MVGIVYGTTFITDVSNNLIQTWEIPIQIFHQAKYIQFPTAACNLDDAGCLADTNHLSLSPILWQSAGAHVHQPSVPVSQLVQPVG